MTEPRVDQSHLAEPATASERHGFALPLVLLVIAVLTVSLAAGFASTTTEIQTNNSQRAEARAFALAENGLQDFVAMRDRRSSGYCAQCGSPPTTTYESTTVTLPGGYATVVAQRVARNLGIKRPAIYLIRSRGVDTTTRLSALLRNSTTHAFVSNVVAERTVAQYAYWDLKVINIVAGWTSLSGLGVNGNAMDIAEAVSFLSSPGAGGTDAADPPTDADVDLLAKARTDDDIISADAALMFVKRRYRKLLAALIFATPIAALAFGVFAWAANPPKTNSPPPAFSITCGMATQSICDRLRLN